MFEFEHDQVADVLMLTKSKLFHFFKFCLTRYDAADMNVYRSALSIGVAEGVANVSEFTWPRDRGLPPPITQPTSINPNSLEQAMLALRQSDEARERRATERAAAEQAAQVQNVSDVTWL